MTTNTPILAIVGDTARMEGRFDIGDSIQVECEVRGELNVGRKLVIGDRGAVNATVKTVDALIMGRFDGVMFATGEVEIADTGRVSGNIQTDSLVIQKGAVFTGNVTKIGAEAPAAPGSTGVQPYKPPTRAERDDRILRGGAPTSA